MATGELRVDAYLWREATHNTKIGPGDCRIAKGTKVEILDDETAVPNNSKVRLLEDGKIVGQYGVLAAQTVGHITTGKLKVSGDALLEQLKIEKPAINGLRRPVVSAFGTDDQYRAELAEVTKACGLVNELVKLFEDRETSIEKWRKAAMGLSAFQVATGATLLSLGIAACVVTVGIAAPVLVALAAAAAGAGMGSGIAKGTMENRMDMTSRRAVTTARSAVVTGVAPPAKSAILSGIKTSAGAAAGSIASSAFSVAGGVAPVAMGLNSMHSLSGVDPASIWTHVNFPEVLAALTQIIDKLEAQKRCAPNIVPEFDRVIAEVRYTVSRIPDGKI